MKYIVIDLEMCKVPKSLRTPEFPWCQETIQIGAVLLDEDFVEVDRFKTFVKPEHGRLDSFIETLTGIQYSDICEAPGFVEAITAFIKWLPSDACCVSWSDSDKHQLMHESESRAFDNDILSTLFDSWIDCQKEFSEKVKSDRNYSLEEALIMASIQPEDGAHDGLIDAINTGKLFTKMNTEKVFKINPIYKAAHEGSTKSLTYSLGEILGKMSFQIEIN